jgi:transcriptional regulator with XRE-family HTH domain
MANFNLIKTIAKDKGITMAELADRIGITPSGLTLLIKANSTNTTTIESIARELEVPVGTFFDNIQAEVCDSPHDINSIVAQKNEIIAQKDKIIEQQQMIISALSKSK